MYMGVWEKPENADPGHKFCQIQVLLFFINPIISYQLNATITHYLLFFPANIAELYS